MSEPTVTVVVERICSLLNEESKILEPAKSKINELLSELEKLMSHLNDANDKGEHIDRVIGHEDATDTFIYKETSKTRGNCSFLRRFLVARAHECEDVIDDIYKSAHEHTRRCSFIKRYICKPCFQIEHQHIQKLSGIIKRLSETNSILENFSVEKPTGQQLGFWDKTQKLPPTTSYPLELVGLIKDISYLVEKLTRKGNQESILYIVGTEGSGKTTLATELKNHPLIKRHFSSVVWASVSQKKDAKAIFLEILRKIQGKEEDASRSTTTEELVHKISNILGQKPYMIIMDDVDNPDNLATHLFPMTQRLNHRSKIVITSCTTPRHPYMHEEYAVAPDENVDSLAKKLTKKETSIFYMSAKTNTAILLKKLYTENAKVKEHFDSRSWIHVYEKEDERSILLKILQEITRDASVIKKKTTDSETESKSETSIKKQNERSILLQSLQEIARDTNMQKESAITALAILLEDFLAKKPSLIVLDQVQEVKDLVGHLHRILKNTKHRSKVIFMTKQPPPNLQENEECITDEELTDDGLLTTKLTGEGEQPSLFSIRDLDGSGRNTVLASYLYNHETVNQHFEHKMWINVSREWNAAETLREIIRRINIDNTSIEDSSTKKLAELLIGALEEKRYMLVINDMNDARDLLSDLVAAQSGIKTREREVALYSKIVITVSNPRTVRHSNLSCLLYEIRPLTEEESWTLLCSIVSNHAKRRLHTDKVTDHFNRYPHKKTKMLKFCKGIPLAIVALGGLLSTKETVEKWETVSTSLGSEETQSDRVLDDILLLCYCDLHSEINPCFLYFSLFPQQAEIPTGLLIRMWLAEGFVTLDPPITEKTSENVAAMYLEELACRCLIQVMRRNHMGEMKSICLHNKIHQLSVTKSANLGFLEIYPSTQNTDTTVLQAATLSRDDDPNIKDLLLRRAAIYPGTLYAYPKHSTKLRTLVQFGRHELSTKHYYFQHEALSLRLEAIYEHFKLLRVLILCGIRNCTILPEQIGDLIFLTYLGLRATSVVELPETIQNLRKLITLDYRGSLIPSICKPLPNVLLQMTKLRHVYLPEKAIPSINKLDLSTLQNLQILWGVSGGNWVTTDLAKLSAPLVKLGIVNISGEEELKAVVKWLNKEPKQLQVLKLDWQRAGETKLLFPDNLNKLQHLRKLSLIGRLKEEYNFQLLTSLIKLELSFSHFKKYDPTKKLGHLPCLKILLLWRSYEGTEWNCAANMFPKLEELQISHLPNLKEWEVAEGAMPCLKRVSIFSCQKLLGLPEGLKHLKQLQELEILNMPMTFCSRLQENENTAAGKDIDIIRNIPCIKFEACEELCLKDLNFGAFKTSQHQLKQEQTSSNTR